MIKVLHIAFLSNKSGGIESVLLNWNDIINPNEMQFDFLTSTKNTIFEEQLTKYGGKVFYFPSLIRHPVKYKKMLESLVRKNKYDVIHIHKNSLCNSLPIYFTKMIQVPKIVLHAHNTSATGGNQIIKNAMHYCNFIPVNMMKINKVACSKVAAEWMFGKKEVKNNNVTYIKNGIHISNFKYEESCREKKRKELNISEDILLVGYVARFSKEKNHDYLIDVFLELEKMKKTKLLLVGSGSLEKVIKEKVRQCGIEEDVIFTGNRTDVNELYQAMDCFVMPSLHEGLPLVGVEAQIAGLPCIFSNEITRELAIIDEVRYLSLKSGTKQWAEEIVEIAGSCKRENAYKKVIAAGYDIRQVVDKLQIIYENKSFK